MAENKQVLILVRGLPGSGKSSFCRFLSESCGFQVFSVDDFFTGVDGEYKFDFSKNHLAYKKCEENVYAALNAGAKAVMVDNTFTIDWEMKPYLQMAETFNCRLHVVTMEKYHHEENIHEIPRDQIRRMAEKFKIRLY